MALTNDDFKTFSDLIDQRIDEKAETVLATKDEIKNLPTKNEFYSWMDKIMAELKNVREEITVLSGLHQKVNNHEIRLEKVEKKVGIQATA